MYLIHDFVRNSGPAPPAVHKQQARAALILGTWNRGRTGVIELRG
jgi:hypothetical protein